MNILIFSHNSGSSKHGMVFRNAAWAKAWVKQGHSVTIVASSFSHSRTINPDVTNRITEEMIDGVRFLWVRGNRYDAKSAFGRVASMALYTAQCQWMPLPLDNAYDVVIASSPHPFAIYPAQRYAKQYNAKLIYDIRDLWPLTLIELGNISPRHPFIQLMHCAESFACRHADLVTSVPHLCEDYLRAHGLPDGRFMAIGNGIDPSDHAPKPMPEQHRLVLNDLRSKGAFIVGYTGTIGLANAVHVLIEAMTQLPSNVHVVLVGRGDDHLDAIKHSIATHNLQERVHLLPPVQREQVQDILLHVDVAYVGTRQSTLYRFGASLTKLNDYMLAKKPIIYAGGDPRNAVEQSGGGIVCQAESMTDVISAVTYFMHASREERDACGQKAYEWLMQNQIISTQVTQILQRLFERAAIK
jgi:glycosyltransferase involved in cell wall biosynthesis